MFQKYVSQFEIFLFGVIIITCSPLKLSPVIDRNSLNSPQSVKSFILFSLYVCLRVGFNWEVMRYSHISKILLI